MVIFCASVLSYVMYSSFRCSKITSFAAVRRFSIQTLNPIEMAFSKLKASLRKRTARSFDAICSAPREICDLVDPSQC